MQARIQEWAERLRRAEEQREPTAALRDEIGSDADGSIAYAIQLANVEHARKQGRRVVGRKMAKKHEPANPPAAMNELV
jgi:2-keto-4-pentenoate hydratase